MDTEIPIIQVQDDSGLDLHSGNGGAERLLDFDFDLKVAPTRFAKELSFEYGKRVRNQIVSQVYF